MIKHDYEMVKILQIDPQIVEAKLLKSGFRKHFNRILTKTLIFDHPTLRLRQSGRVLRLREVGPRVFLSIKAGHEHISQNPFQKIQETEIVVDDFMLTFRLLESLGFSAFRYQEKYKSVYSGPQSVKIEIDEYPKIPPFMEVEAPTKAPIEKIVTDLGYSVADSVTMSANEILKYYGIKDSDIVRFPQNSESEIKFK